MQEITTGDPVLVLSGNRKGDVGKVLAIDRREKAHFIYWCYHVLFPDGAVDDFECCTPKTEKGKDLAKPLNIEKVIEQKPTDGMIPEAKPAKEKAPAKPEPPEIVILREGQTKVNQSKPKPAKE